MITSHGVYATATPMELYGLSGDIKPTVTFNGVKIENGSSFLEMDTSKVYLYDAENDEWKEQ